MKILTEIINSKKKEVKAIKEKYSYKDFESSSLFSQKKRSLTKALTPDKFGIIAEMKRKSPSAGLINTSFDIIQQGKIYEGSGAVAISCLTDYYYFGGYNNDLTLLKSATTIPLLRKEFIIDEIQLFESKAIGADAILLIAEILTKEQSLHLTVMAQSLGMEVLMECHSYKELKKVNEFVDIIGANNRNLQTQKTSIQTSFDLYDFIPEQKICISESGIRSKNDLIKLSAKGYKGALIGEHILANSNPSKTLTSLQLQPSELC